MANNVAEKILREPGRCKEQSQLGFGQFSRHRRECTLRERRGLANSPASAERQANHHIIVILILLLAPPSLAATIFVDNLLPGDCIGTYCIANRDNSGSDGNAYNTAQKAANVSAPGDTILFRAGTYYERTSTQARIPVLSILTSGTVAAPITYKNYNNEVVIINASDPVTGVQKRNAIEMGIQPVPGQGVQNIILDGLIVEGGAYRGLAIFGPADQYTDPANPTENVIIRHVIGRYNTGGASGFGIQSNGTLVNVTIEDCEAYGNAITGIQFGRIDKTWHNPEPEDQMSAARYSTIRNCLAYSNNDPTNPGDTDGISGSHMYRCTFENNVVFANSDDGMDLYASIEVTARNNIIFGHNYPGGNGCGLKFSAGGGGRHTIEGNVVFNNAGFSYECSNPSNPLRTYYPSKIYNNLAYNGRTGFSLGLSYDTSYRGFDRVYLRNNIGLDNNSHDIYGMSAGLEDSDYNFFSNGSDLQNMLNISQDSHSLTGDPQLVDKTVVIDTNFASAWGILEKLEHIRSQVRAAFSPSAGSVVIDAGKVVSGYHNPNPGDTSAGGEVWGGFAPDIGAYESVDPNNPAPVLGAIGSKAVSENSTLNFGVSATDSNGDPITYLAENLPIGATFSNQIFSWTPGFGYAGTYDVRITATDGNSQDSEIVAVTVYPHAVDPNNQPPVLQAIGDKTVDENATLSFTISATDPTGDPIAYSAQNLPGGATLNPQTGAFAWTPSYGQAGSYTVTFVASDGNWYDSEPITITVNLVNRPPVLGTISDQSVMENTQLSFSVSASDPDGQTLTYSASGLPSGASFANRTFAWTPAYNQAGTYNVTFTVSDGQAQDSQAITITVVNVNGAPVLAAIGSQSVWVGYAFTLTINATDPDGDSMTYSASGIPAGATFSNGTFSWTATQAEMGSYNVTFYVSDGQLQDYETVAMTVRADGQAPTVTNLSPASGSIQAPLDSLIILHVTDAGAGVDADSVIIELDGAVIYTGDVSSYSSANGTCLRVGTPADYTYAYQSDALFDFDDLKTVTVNAANIRGVAMAEQSYSFRTEMRSFGQNKLVSSGAGLDAVGNGTAATARDSRGNIWAVWHAGPTGSRDIYLGKLTAGASAFDTSIQLTNSSADQVNPDIACANDTVYVVWQENRREDWDVWGATSADWSNQRLIADSDPQQHFNQINPAVAVDSGSPNHAYVAWQDDREGNQDIYIAESTDAFVTNTITPVTSHTSDQTGPAIAVNSSNTVYVLWTDARNTANGTDIYGASGGSPWTNVPVICKTADQSSPRVAAESAGSVIHMVWLDRSSGNGDIYYDLSTGLPAAPLTGGNLVDDAVGAVQLAPTIAVAGVGAGRKVFVSWQDSRNVSGGSGDLDIYMVQANSGSGTNVFVGDGGTNSNQTEPALGVDQNGYPYVVWTDSRGTSDGIYFAASTCMQSTPLLSGAVTASSGGTVGNSDVGSINDVDDVSIAVPAGASPYDVKVSIMRMENPRAYALPLLNEYEFSPSGLQFSSPATITIPYTVSSTGGAPTAYWYNSITGTLSQQGIGNIEIIGLTSSLYVLRFTTTHLTPYSALLGAAGDVGGSDGGSTQGGNTRGKNDKAQKGKDNNNGGRKKK